MVGKDEDSDFLQHCKTKHGGQMKNLKMDVIETFKGDPALRQISEALESNELTQRKSSTEERNTDL